MPIVKEKLVIDHIVDFLKELPAIIWQLNTEAQEGFNPNVTAFQTCQDKDGSYLRHTIDRNYCLKPVSIRISEERGFIVRFSVQSTVNEDIKFVDYDFSSLDDSFPEILSYIDDRYKEAMSSKLKASQWSMVHSFLLVNEYMHDRVKYHNKAIKNSLNLMLSRGSEREELVAQEQKYNKNPHYGAF